MNNKQNKEIAYISLDQIRPHAENPNIHQENDVRTLALNIREFGLIHPIGVVRNEESDSYTIVVGEGRYKAFQLLTQQWPDEDWGTIPAIVLEESDDYSVWGRRLSENKLRSFNWIGECIELAHMKADGKSRSELARLFGYSETHIANMTSIGQLPDIEKVAPAAGATLVTLRDVEKYVLPLRVQSSRQGNIPQWDYTEVSACIEKLSTGDLSREDLPAYSAERREAIGKKSARTEEPGDTNRQNPKADVDVKALERRLAEAQTKYEADIQEHSGRIQELTERLNTRDNYVKQLEHDYEHLLNHDTEAQQDSEVVKDLQERLHKSIQIAEVQEKKISELYQQCDQLQEQLSEHSRPEITDELVQQIEAKVRKAVRQEFEEEQQAKIEELNLKIRELEEGEKLLSEQPNLPINPEGADLEGWSLKTEASYEAHRADVALAKLDNYYRAMSAETEERMFQRVLELSELVAEIHELRKQYLQEKEEQSADLAEMPD